MEYPIYRNKKDINQGCAKVWFCELSEETDWDEEALLFLGSVDTEDGIIVEEIDEFFEHRSDGVDLDHEIIGQGIRLRINLLEVGANIYRLLKGYGNETSLTAQTVTFTDQKVVFYGNNETNLPFNNIATITAVTDDSATPVSYLATDVEIVGTAGDNEGVMRIPSDSNITTDEDGITLYVSGTRTRNLTAVFEPQVNTTQTDRYGFRVAKRNKEGNWHYWDIWAAMRSTPLDAHEMQNGNKYVISCDFQGIKVAGQDGIFKRYFEKA